MISQKTARQLRLDLEQMRSDRREDFVVGPSNAGAVAALDALQRGALAVVGPRGSGKTHLVRAWAGDEHSIPRIVVDDADRSDGGEELFHLLNQASRGEIALVMAARMRPIAWPAPLPDLRSRLNALPVAEIAAPDDEVLEGVLRRFFRARNIRPPEAVYPYLLSRMDRSIPDAAEIVRRLDEAGDEGFRPVTRALARQVLERSADLFEAPSQNRREEEGT